MPERAAPPPTEAGGGKRKGLSDAFHEIPTWGWWVAAILGVVLVIIRLRTGGASSSGGTTAAGVANSPGPQAPTVFDPATGATEDYGTALGNLLYSEQLTSSQFSQLQDTMQQQSDVITQLQHDLAALQLAGVSTPNPTPAPTDPAFQNTINPIQVPFTPDPTPAPIYAPVDTGSALPEQPPVYQPMPTYQPAPTPTYQPPIYTPPAPPTYFPPAQSAPMFSQSPYAGDVASGASLLPSLPVAGPGGTGLFIPTYPLAPTPAPTSSGGGSPYAARMQ